MVGWFLGCFSAVARVFRVVDRVFLGYLGWLLSYCYMVARVFRVVAMVLICSY